MILSKVQFQSGVIDIILWLPSSPITDKTPLMLLPTMHIKLIISIKPLSTEPTLRVAFKATLVDSARIVVAFFHMSI